jgi:hypothetical protein
MSEQERSAFETWFTSDAVSDEESEYSEQFQKAWQAACKWQREADLKLVDKHWYKGSNQTQEAIRKQGG